MTPLLATVDELAGSTTCYIAEVGLVGPERQLVNEERCFLRVSETGVQAVCFPYQGFCWPRCQRTSRLPKAEACVRAETSVVVCHELYGSLDATVQL